MEKRLLTIFTVLILIGITACDSSAKNTNNSTDDDNDDEINSTRPPAVPTNEEIITKAELAKHKTKEDCWISYKGKAYDLTNWRPKHPGTAGAISPFCGTSSEFEKAFIDKHETSKVDKLIEEGTFKGDLI